MKRQVAFVHTSPAAIGPLMQFYAESAPELEITNLLDDGLLRLLASRRLAEAQDRLADMIATARRTYGAELAMITCSSVSTAMVEQLRRRADVPILKIDYPMARMAVKAGRKIGVIATFPPTLEPTSNLLADAAAEAGAGIELVPEVVPEAYQALLTGDHKTHDGLLLAAIGRLDERNVDAIVLAQVSMARILPQLHARTGVPVLSSLSTSLVTIRETLEPM